MKQQESSFKDLNCSGSDTSILNFIIHEFF